MAVLTEFVEVVTLGQYDQDPALIDSDSWSGIRSIDALFQGPEWLCLLPGCMNVDFKPV